MHYKNVVVSLVGLWAAIHANAAPITQKVLNDMHRPFDIIVMKLVNAGIIPDVLPWSFSPTYSLTLAYPSTHDTVSLGNTIPVPSTQDRPVYQLLPLALPSVTLTPTRTLSSNKTYTLVLSDPDATSRASPTMGQMCHWVLTGISRPSLRASSGEERVEASQDFPSAHEDSHGLPLVLDALAGVDAEGAALTADAARELVEYLAPAPPKKTGLHRYVFVLLEGENSGEGGQEVKPPADRPHWGYEEMGRGVMDWAEDNGLRPVAANFFYAQHEKQ